MSLFENLTAIADASTAPYVSLAAVEIPGSEKKRKSGKPLKAFVLTLEGAENRWNVESTAAIRKALKYAKESNEASVLISRSSAPKFFSNGLDLPNLNMADTEFANKFAIQVMSAFADVLDLPIPTICVVQGHAFGAGFMYALAHDYRIQQSAKGFMCANEIELGMRIPRSELDLFAHAMTSADFFETVNGAKRWDGAEAYRKGVVHSTGKNEQEIQTALLDLLGRVAHLGLNRPVMNRFKRDTKGHIADGLRYFNMESFDFAKL